MLQVFFGQAYGGDKAKKRLIKETEREAACLTFFCAQVNRLGVWQEIEELKSKDINYDTFIYYTPFVKALSKAKLLLFRDEVSYSSFSRLFKLLKLKIHNQPDFIPANNLDLWLRSEDLFDAKTTDVGRLEDYAFKTMFLFYDFLIPLNAECEELDDADRVEIKQYNNQLNELKQLLTILHKKKLEEPLLDNNLLEDLFNQALNLLEKYPIHLACCDKEDIRVIVWLGFIDYFLLLEKQFYEKCLPTDLTFHKLMQGVILILQRYFVILSDNPKEQMEKLKVFCKQIGLECQATEERTEEEDNGLTPSTTPSTSPVPPNETPSPSTTPPLRPTEQPMPVRPSTITRAARRPTTSFASEVLRLFGW